MKCKWHGERNVHGMFSSVLGMFMCFFQCIDESDGLWKEAVSQSACEAPHADVSRENSLCAG